METNLYFKLAIALCGLTGAAAILFDKSRKSYDLLAWAMIAAAADYLIWDLFYHRGGLKEVFVFLRVFRGFQLVATLTLWAVTAWQLWAIAIAGNALRRQRTKVKRKCRRLEAEEEEPTTQIPEPPDEL